MNPSTASAGVAKLAMPLAAKSLRASRLAASPSQVVITGLTGAPVVLRCRAWPRPLGHLGARGECRRTIHDQDRIRVLAGQPGPRARGVPCRVGVADNVDRIAVRPGRRQDRVQRRAGRSERVASRPPRSPSRSAASTPAPPPLVRMASRSPVSRGCRARISAALKRSSSSRTRSTPARRNAAS